MLRVAKGGAGRSGAHWVRGLVAGALLAPLLAAVPPAARATGTTERVSLDDAEVEGNGASTEVAVSDDGNHIAFVSEASNLVAGDTNGEADVFVRNRATGTTVRVSVATDGTQALNDPSPDGKALSAHPAISPNGRFVVFQSEADNLIGALQDTNASRDVFVHDRDTDNDGTFDEAGAVSTTLVSVHHDTGQEAAGDSWRPAVSSTGRYVAFDTRASLVVADAVANSSDVYVRDRDADGDGIFDEAGLGDTATILVSVESDEVIGNNSSASAAISPDGRYVAFDSVATNLVSGDTNAKRDVFLRDRTSGTTVRASLADDETESNDDSNNPDVSSDGRYVVFDSAATDLVTGDTNGVREVFLRDLTGATTARVSVANDGSQSTGGESSFPSMSDDARYVAFHSAATNLVTGDANAVNDVFVRDRQTPSTVRISVASAGTEGNGASLGASLGSNGAFAAYESVATNLVSGDANALSDAFVHQVEYPPPTTTTTTTTTTAVSPTTTTTTPTPTTTTTTASPTTTTTVPASTTTTTTVPASTTTTTAPPGGTTTTLPVATTVPLPPASPSIPGVSPAPSSDGSTPFGPGSSKPPLVQVELSRRAEPVVGAPARGSAKRWLWDSSTPIVVLATVSLFGAVGVLLLVGGLGAALFFPFPLRRRRREDGDDPPGPA